MELSFKIKGSRLWLSGAQPPRKNSKSSALERPRYVLLRILAELYSHYQENFSPDWRDPLPSEKCEFFGKTICLEAYSPNAKGLGFLDWPF